MARPLIGARYCQAENADRSPLRVPKGGCLGLIISAVRIVTRFEWNLLGITCDDVRPVACKNLHISIEGLQRATEMIDRITRKTLRFLADEDGPTTVEYAVMLMLILMAVIGTVQLLGFALSENLEDSQQKLQQAMDGRDL